MEKSRMRRRVMKDKKCRSLLKAITWRVVAVFITFFVSFILTGKIILATAIGLVDSFIKIFVYYFHERVWEAVNFWRIK